MTATNLRNLALAALFGLAILSDGASRADEEKGQDVQYQKAFDEAIDKALQYLAKAQLPDGSFPSKYQRNNAISSLCVMAFLARGYCPGLAPYGDLIDRSIDSVLDSQTPDGSLIGVGEGQMYCHNIATLMLSEVSGIVDPARQKRVDAALSKALKLILDAQQIPKSDAQKGGWRYTPKSNDSDISHSGWALMALRSARNNGAQVPKQAIDDAVAFILRCRHNEGGFGYQPGGGPGLGRTGVGLLCLELCGRHREEASVKAGSYILDHFQKDNDKDSTFYYQLYYCSQGMFQLGDQEWEAFAPMLYETLLKLQEPDGSWPPRGNHETAPGQCYSTAMAVLALSVTYRQLPIYQR